MKYNFVPAGNERPPALHRLPRSQNTGWEASAPVNEAAKAPEEVLSPESGGMLPDARESATWEVPSSVYRGVLESIEYG
jgi:hypothetical protein